MKHHAGTEQVFSLKRGILDAGGVIRSADEGQTAFRWQGHPEAFVLLVSGDLTVHFRPKARQVRWAECRASAGQDCMPVTAAILSEREIAVRASCTAPTTWIELPSPSLVLLVNGHTAFRRALFAQHATRLPTFFERIEATKTVSFDRRIAEWLLCHAKSGEVAATHLEIADDLLTAREVVSRKLQEFARKGWITQGRGFIRLGAPAALSRLAKNTFSVCGHRPGPTKQSCG